MNENEERRTSRMKRLGEKVHALYVALEQGGLVVRCECGQQLGGRRTEDRQIVSLSDLLELVRSHSATAR